MNGPKEPSPLTSRSDMLAPCETLRSKNEGKIGNRVAAEPAFGILSVPKALTLDGRDNDQRSRLHPPLPSELAMSAQQSLEWHHSRFTDLRMIENSSVTGGVLHMTGLRPPSVDPLRSSRFNRYRFVGRIEHFSDLPLWPPNEPAA